MSKSIGFIGLGSLGRPIAINLLESGYSLTVYNRTQEKAEPLVAKGARIAGSAAETISAGGVVVSVLWDADAVEEVVTRDGFLDRLGPGSVHICMSTGAPAQVRRLAALHAGHGVAYIEALVFGRPEAATARKLWIPVSGPQAAKDRVRPILTALGAQGVYDFGEEPGTATMVKLAGNFMIISAARSMAEAMTTLGKSGVDVPAAVQMLTGTLFSAPIYQSYGKLIAEGKPPFLQSAIPAKDLALFQAAAQEIGLSTPIAERMLNLARS